MCPPISRRSGGPLAGLLALSVAAAMSFAALTEEIREGGGPLNIDLSVQEWMRSHRTDVLDALFSLLTWAGSIVILIPLCLAAAAYLWNRKAHHVIAPVVLAPLIATALVELLKAFFRRTRPASELATAIGYSFPSGHTTAATAVYFTLAYVGVREGMVPASASIASLLLVLAVGMSRIYLDVHWASDVAGGLAAGSLIAAVCAVLYERARKVEREAKLANSAASGDASHGA